MKKTIFSFVICLLAGSLYAQTQIIAHRGFWNCEGSAENSISALKNVQRERFYGSEVDVHTTLDGVVVANHDNDINGIIINDKTFAELQNIRLKNGESLPTLKSHLELLVENPATKLIIEIKPKKQKQEEDKVVDAVLKLVKETKAEGLVEYISFSKYICQELKRKMPSAIVVYLSGSLETALTPQELKAEGFDGLDYHHRLISAHPDWIKEAKELGLITNVWTVNDEATMKAMLELEVDFITTDKPLELRNIITNKSFHVQAVRNGVMDLSEHRRPNKREIISIPDINGYKVLKCDFHVHTVFSDGHVWPNVRIQEAWWEGLDAISLTEHVEYQPHQEDVKTNHNRSYELAENGAKRNNIILVKGTEITRMTPPGHFNAIYVSDVSDYIDTRAENEPEKDRAAVMKAKEQNAFIFWNHPGWQPGIEGSYEWLDFIDNLYKNKALHGIEVFNGFHFHTKALDWCIDKGLTVLGTSDIHNLVQHDYNMNQDYVHRSMTLVMAKDRTPESIREALDAGRTVAWASKYLAGKEENVRDLFNACVEIMPAYHAGTDRNGKTINHYIIRNDSDLYFDLCLTSGNGTERIILYPHSEQQITAQSEQNSLSYDVVTAYVRSDKYLNITFPLK